MKNSGYGMDIVCGSMVSANLPPVTVNPFVTFTGTGLKNSFSVSENTLSRQTLILGGNGSGKTNIFYRFLGDILCRHRASPSSNDTVIVFDTKGEFYRDFVDLSRDCVIGNSVQFRGISERWNIFNELMCGLEDIRGAKEKRRQFIMNARELSQELFEGRGSKTQPFFVRAASDIFFAILVYFYDRRTTELDNASLLRFIREKEVKDYIEIFKTMPDFRYLLSYLGKGDNTQALGVMAEFNSMVSDFFTGIFEERGDMSMRRLVRNGGKVIFIEYDMSMGSTLAPMYRLIIDMALKEALSRSTTGNVYLIVDEFKLLPKLKYIEDGLNFGRGLNVKIIAGIQSISQLTDIYGKEGGMVLAGGFSNLFAFHTNDYVSREYIRNLFGRNLISEYYSNASGKAVDREREGNTVEDWELTALKIGECVISLAESPPFWFKFDKYTT